MLGGGGRGGEWGGGRRRVGQGKAWGPRHGGWLWSTAPGTYAGHFRVVQGLGFRVWGLGIGVWGFLFLKTKNMILFLVHNDFDSWHHLEQNVFWLAVLFVLIVGTT